MEVWMKALIILFVIHVIVNLVQLGKLENIREQLKAIIKHYGIKNGEL